MPAGKFLALQLGNARLPRSIVEPLHGVARMIPFVGDHLGGRLWHGSRINRGKMLSRAGKRPRHRRCIALVRGMQLGLDPGGSDGRPRRGPYFEATRSSANLRSQRRSVPLAAFHRRCAPVTSASPTKIPAYPPAVPAVVQMPSAARLLCWMERIQSRPIGLLRGSRRARTTQNVSRTEIAGSEPSCRAGIGSVERCAFAAGG
jgi:hypothetical protein